MLKDHIYFINERGPHFWGTHELAKETQYAKLNAQGNMDYLSSEEYAQTISSLKGKKVLIYVHGLQTSHDEVITSQIKLVQNITTLRLKIPLFSRLKSHLLRYLGYTEEEAYSNHCPYDVIIGYSWPSFNKFTHYYQAKKHALTLSPKFAKQLSRISAAASFVDIMAHSMGNMLVFEALSQSGLSIKKVNHIFSVAAAVPCDALNQNGKYFNVFNTCQKLFVFHSTHDSALSWPFYLAESASLALGLTGPHPQLKHLHQLEAIDASSIIKGHSEYISSKDFYDYLLKIHDQTLSSN